MHSWSLNWKSFLDYDMIKFEKIMLSHLKGIEFFLIFFLFAAYRQFHFVTKVKIIGDEHITWSWLSSDLSFIYIYLWILNFGSGNTAQEDCIRRMIATMDYRNYDETDIHDGKVCQLHIYIYFRAVCNLSTFHSLAQHEWMSSYNRMQSYTETNYSLNWSAASVFFLQFLFRSN